jgi:hypothetical protein
VPPCRARSIPLGLPYDGRPGGHPRVRRHSHHRHRSAPRAASPAVPALSGPGPHHKRRQDSRINGRWRRRKRATSCTRRATCCTGRGCGPMPLDIALLSAGAVMADASPNRRQTIQVVAGVAFAQVGIVGFDEQFELEALRLFGLPEHHLLFDRCKPARYVPGSEPPFHSANHFPVDMRRLGWQILQTCPSRQLAAMNEEVPLPYRSPPLHCE